MNLLQEVQKMAVTKKVPAVAVGQTVRVHQRIKEGEKERVQIFEGLIIKVNSGHGADKTFTVRKMVGGIGVEKVFPLYSTNIVKIEVRKKAKVRRAKLYYLRERSGKSARLKETFVSDEERQAFEEPDAPEVAEETTENTEATEAPATEETPKEEAPAEEKAEEKAEEPAAEEAASDDKKDA